MIKRILSCLLIVVAIACKDDSEGMGIHTFSALADVTNSPSLTDADEKYNMIVMYSTDQGATFVDWPSIKKGDQYWAKVVLRDGSDQPVQPFACFGIDWSGSNPAPESIQGGMAQFTMNKDNALVALITDTDYGPFDHSVWVGDFTGKESGTCCSSADANTFSIDPSDPNKIIMDNFWGDGVTAYLVFTPSTSKDNQVVTLPAQDTSEGGSIAAATGVYDECSQTISIPNIAYTVGGDTYTFNYDFHR